MSGGVGSGGIGFFQAPEEDHITELSNKIKKAEALHGC